MFDKVKCLNCEKESHIEPGGDICPKCGVEGCLTWVNENEPMTEIKETYEVELRKYECENGHVFYVECDATDYPDSCPYCQNEKLTPKGRYSIEETDDYPDSDTAQCPNCGNESLKMQDKGFYVCPNCGTSF